MDGLFGDVDDAVDDAIDDEAEQIAADPDRAPPSSSPAPLRSRRQRAAALETASRTVATQASRLARRARRAKPWVPALGGGVLAGAVMAAGLWGSRRIERGKPGANEKLLELDTSTIVPVAAAALVTGALVYLGLKARDFVRGDDDEASASGGGGNLFATAPKAAREEAPSTASSDPSMQSLEQELAGLLGN